MTAFKPRDRVHLKGHPHTSHTTGTVRSIDAVGVHVLWDDGEVVTAQMPLYLEPAGEPMSQEPLDLTAHDLDIIRTVAGGGSSGDVMTIKNTTVLALLDRVEAAELWTVAHPCQVSHEQPYDFKWCETHDRTFPLDGDCDHKGKSALDWQDAREQEQRVRALRAEARAESAESKVAAVEAAYKEKHYDAEGNHAVYAWAIRAALDGGA